MDLIADYHRNHILDTKEIFNRFKIVDFDKKREPNITHYERFITMLIRAVSYKKDILIARVFEILPQMDNIGELNSEFVQVSKYIDTIKFLDFTVNKHRYKENSA